MTRDPNDELFLGTQRAPARDTDGDGVSDAQESLDGTDPNDAADSIRHDQPVVGQSPDDSDPRGVLREVSLERETIVDVAGSIPAGQSLDQALPTGLDGKPLPTGPNHYGNADAEKFLGGRGDDSNSPLNMSRDPAMGGAKTKPEAGRDSTKDTLGREPGSGASTDAKGVGTGAAGGGQGDTKPPGWEPSGTSNPAHNMDLVSQTVTPKASARWPCCHTNSGDQERGPENKVPEGVGQIRDARRASRSVEEADRAEEGLRHRGR